MSGCNWARTLLSAYRLVPKVVNDVENIIKIQALKSSGFFESTFSHLSTLSQIDKMEKLFALKSRAIFLKDYVDEIMSRLSAEQQFLLSEIFFKNNKITAVVEFQELSARTYYRKIKKALADFERKIENNSYGISDFERDYANDNWFFRLKECNNKAA